MPKTGPIGNGAPDRQGEPETRTHGPLHHRLARTGGGPGFVRVLGQDLIAIAEETALELL